MKDDPHVIWQGRSYTLTKWRKGWRLRSRQRGNEIDWHFPGVPLSRAKEQAIERFEGVAPVRVAKGIATLQNVVDAYREMPKRAAERSAYNNITRLTKIVRVAWGMGLDRALVTNVRQLWADYFTKKLGGRLDLSTRRQGNAALNSAVRMASSLFIERLRPLYRERGIEIPEDATSIQWLPEMKRPKPPAQTDELAFAWSQMEGSTMFYAIGLARYAGLRQQEIAACRRNWIVQDGGAVYVEMMDRPEEGFLSKTGEIYRALVINPVFAACLLACPEGEIVRLTPLEGRRDRWFERAPQAWVKKFTGTAKMPLHRLRGLYADDVKRLTEDAVAARLAGVKAAADALGHTNTQTTVQSYLST